MTETMPYHGNDGEQAEEESSSTKSAQEIIEEYESMPQFEVYYDSDVGSGKQTVRAVNDKEAAKIIEDRPGDTVVNAVEKVAE